MFTIVLFQIFGIHVHKIELQLIFIVFVMFYNLSSEFQSFSSFPSFLDCYSQLHQSKYSQRHSTALCSAASAAAVLLCSTPALTGPAQGQRASPLSLMVATAFNNDQQDVFPTFMHSFWLLFCSLVSVILAFLKLY